MRGSRLLALAILSLVPTAAIQLLGAGPRSASAQEDQLLDRGLELYVAGCASCHGVTGEGTGQGPSLVGVGAASVDFMLSTGRMPLADPGDQPTRNAPRYSPEEIEAIVAFVTSLGPGGPAVPAVSPAGGGLGEGRELYVANCLACHGAAGQGASVGGGAVAPALDRATATQIAEATRIGPGMMPLFGDEQIDGRDLNALVRYVLALRDPDDRGGLGLGHVGPVIEGLIGWLVGLGVLLLVVRLTGTAR
jgi:quinol---cytochrome-c reductase cytochrome c subunit